MARVDVPFDNAAMTGADVPFDNAATTGADDARAGG